MKRIYLLRHAKSSWKEPGLADHERPLAPRGRRAAARMAAYLGENEVRPALVLCSSARRTRETVERLGPVLGASQVEIDDDLYAASSQSLLDRLRRTPQPVESVLLVGHNPGLHELALTLVQSEERTRLEAKFPTGALASLQYDGGWPELAAGSCELVDFIAPRELR